jgi:hypothetical protein
MIDLNKLFGICLLLAILPVVSCKKDDSNSSTSPGPEITAIQPASGPKGTQVLITGSGFSTVVTGNKVFFNGKTAQVINAAATSLLVVVPAGAGSGNVVVQVDGRQDTGPVFDFIYTVAITTFCGTGTPGYNNGNYLAARFNSPRGLAIDEFDNIYVADEQNHRIRIVYTNGDAGTFSGSGIAGHQDGNPSSAKFNFPSDIAYDPVNDYFYVADRMNHCVRRLNPSGIVSTAAGIPGSPGFVDGPGQAGRLNEPAGVALEGEMTNVYIADAGNHCIRKLDFFDILSTFAGSAIAGQADGTGSAARFNSPFDITFDTAGYLFVSDVINENIRRITLSGDVMTFAGSGLTGSNDGQGLLASFNSPHGLYSVNNEVLVCDYGNHLIRKIIPSGFVSTIGGDGTPGFTNGQGTNVKLNNPGGIIRDSQGNYFFSETGNHVIRKMVVD